MKSVLSPEILSFSGERKTKFEWTRKTQKGRPLGQKFSQGTTKLNLRDKKTILYPPKGHQNLFVSSRWKKGKIWAAKKNLKKNWPWQKKACKNMKKTMKKWIRGPKSLSPGSFPFSPSQLPITKFYLVLNPFTLSPFLFYRAHFSYYLANFYVRQTVKSRRTETKN